MNNYKKPNKIAGKIKQQTKIITKLKINLYKQTQV